MKYMVTFKYSSFYEDESENKVAEDTLEYEAKDLDESVSYTHLTLPTKRNV